MNFVVPVPSETIDVALDDGATIRVRRHGNPAGPRLMVTHGNGFAADAYLPFWQLLTPDYDVLVFDFRNHGQNLPVQWIRASAARRRSASSIRCRAAPR